MNVVFFETRVLSRQIVRQSNTGDTLRGCDCYRQVVHLHVGQHQQYGGARCKTCTSSPRPLAEKYT